MEETQYKPEILEKRRKYTRYKGKVEFYKKLSVALAVMLLGAAYVIFLTMRGNLALAQQLDKAQTTVIMPSGKSLTR